MRNWTDEQREAIEARGQNLLVSAGAGSGKTAVMIERICALLREGADLRETVVCTFTKTAAADMKRKLAAAMGGESDPRLRAQLRFLARAEISTLHSWCAHLIKQWFFDTDIDPEFTVLEEGEERALKSAAADAAIEEAKASGDRAFAGLYAVFLKNRSHRRLREAALSVYDYARAQPAPLVWLGKSAQCTDEQYRAQLREELRKEREALCAKMQSVLPAMACAAPADYAAFNALCACARAGVPYDTPLSRAGNKPEYAQPHETLKSLKAEYAALTKRGKKIDEMPDCGSSLPYCHALASLVIRTDELYCAAKRARGKADYADLEHGALRILRGEHGKEIAGKYKHVFVDEYQDISPLQEEILSHFPCEMFYVGDLKQSIYGFRMCRPDFFRDKLEKYAGGAGKAVQLTANFRSGGEILSFVNEIFSATMTKDFGGADYKSAPFRAGKQLAGAVRARLVDVPEEEDAPIAGVYSVQNDTAQCSDPETDAETDAAVDEILRMLDEEIPDEQAGEGKTRPVRYGDVAVLVRSRGAFTVLLEKKLRALGIPVSSAASDTPADAFPSVSQLLSLLSLADNARDDVSLAAVMLSPIFGNFTADELAQIKKERAGGTFYDGVRAYAERGQNGALRQKTQNLLADLARWRRTAAETTVADLAGEITAHYGCFSKCLLYGGTREAAALDAFIEHLAAAENDTLHDYLRYLASCGAPRLNVAGGGGAVRILTVHASKGLEFPCVVLPGLHKQFNLCDVRASVLCDEREGVVLRTFDFENRTVTENARFAAVARRMRRAVGEEELRILYVAMTRAQYRLSLIARKRKTDEESRATENANAYLDWLYGFLVRVADKTQCDPYAAEEGASEEDTPVDENTVRMLEERFAAEERAGAQTTLGVRKASVTGVSHAQGDEERPAPALWSDDDRAARKGTAYHTFMQWGDWRSAHAYEQLCARFPEEGKLVDRDEICAAFANAARFTGDCPHVREKAFVYNAAAREIGIEGDGNVLVQGVIDLMVLRENGVEIVDYKTGGEESLRNPAYKKQLRLYKRAVEKTLGKKVTATYLYAFYARKFIKIDVEED